jgi:streptomycin 6-kinase
VAFVAPARNLDPRRLLRWAAAGAGLSAAWSLMGGDRTGAAVALGVTEAALAELDL